MDQIRTQLANERTFLAYERTAVTFLLAGLTIIKLFSEEKAVVFIGWALVIISPIITIVGIKHKIDIDKKCAQDKQ